MTEPLPDTWHNRDLPVLRTIVRLLDETGQSVRAEAVEATTGLTEHDVQRAAAALRDDGLIDVNGAAGLDMLWANRVSGEARRLAGSWPTPDAGADRLIAALEHLAENAPTEDERTRARKMLDAAAGAGRDIAVSVAAAVITGQLS